MTKKINRTSLLLANIQIAVYVTLRSLKLIYLYTKYRRIQYSTRQQSNLKNYNIVLMYVCLHDIILLEYTTADSVGNSEYSPNRTIICPKPSHSRFHRKKLMSSFQYKIYVFPIRYIGHHEFLPILFVLPSHHNHEDFKKQYNNCIRFYNFVFVYFAWKPNKIK